MRTDDKVAAAPHGGAYALEYVPLNRLFKVGKRQVAAQHQIERTLGRLMSDILHGPLNLAAQCRLQDSATILLLEGEVGELVGKILKGGDREDCILRSLQHMCVGIGGDDPQGERAAGLCGHSKLPHNL